MSSSFATPRTMAHKAPLSMEFSSQQYWSGLPFTSQGILPTQWTLLPWGLTATTPVTKAFSWLQVLSKNNQLSSLPAPSLTRRWGEGPFPLQRLGLKSIKHPDPASATSLTSIPIHSAAASMYNTKYAPASGPLYMPFSHLKCSYLSICMTFSHLIQILTQTSPFHKAFQ